MAPDKDPSTWAGIWLALTDPSWQGAIMAVSLSLLRVLYDAKETSKLRIVLEALMCGGLSLSVSSIIEWMAWPPNLSIGAGGAIGFIGITAIRELIIRLISRKIDAA